MLHETDTYALVIEMEYGKVTDMSSINASDLDQPPCDKMYTMHGVKYFSVFRRCVLHETDSYAFVIEMEYRNVTDMCSINASDLDQPPCEQLERISFCVKSL